MKHSDPFWKPTLILTACLALLISFTSFAQSYAPAESPSGLRVSGSASVSAVPDQAVLNFSIEQRGNKLSSLKTQVDQYTTALLSDLRKRDIPDANIRSYQLNVYPQYDTSGDGKREQSGFIVMRSIEVTLPSLELYDQIIDLALAQGVTRVGQVQFQISNQQKLYEQALQQAFLNAQQKASFIAETAGVELSGVVRIEEQSMSQPVMMQMAEARSQSKSPSLPGEQQVEARLEVVFSLKNKD